MNPRYLAYCRAHNKTPDDMLAFDKEQYPGGCMCGFILWMSTQWSTFEAQHIRLNKFEDRHLWRMLNMAAFDVWLNDAAASGGVSVR